MQVIFTFYRQEEMANDARGRRRVGPSRGAAPSAGCPRGRQLFVGRDHPCEEFLDRRPALPSVKSRAGNDSATRAALPRDAFARSRSPRVASAGAAHAVPGVFEMRCFARRRPDNPQRRRGPRRRCDGRIGQRRSVVRCGQGDANARTHNDREGTMPLASNAADRTLLGQRWRARRRAGTEQKFAVRQRGVVEPALYTVEGRQTGDLRQKCGSALIRKAKLPARSCGRPCLFGRDG